MITIPPNVFEVGMASECLSRARAPVRTQACLQQQLYASQPADKPLVDQDERKTSTYVSRSTTKKPNSTTSDTTA